MLNVMLRGKKILMHMSCSGVINEEVMSNKNLVTFKDLEMYYGISCSRLDSLD